MGRRVVITGIGLHTALGDTSEALFDGLLAGRCASRTMPEWTVLDDLRTTVGAPVAHFDGSDIPRKTRRTMGRVGMLAASAAARAVSAARLPTELLQDGDTAVILGSTHGSSSTELESFESLITTRSVRGQKSTTFFQVMAHSCAANVALYLGIQGELFSTNSACASASQAIGLAMQRIRDGYIERAVAGGAEELNVLGAMIFQSIGAASEQADPASTPRPFDAGRDGIVVGEGAGVLVLETLEAALARNAPILAEVVGFGTTCDAVHIVDPSVTGMERALRRCLHDARLQPHQVDAINAHATGTRNGDATEAEALLRTFGDQVPVTSNKGQLGHTLGACGAIEAAIAVESLNRGLLPANHHLTQPDVAPIHLVREPLQRPVRRIMSTNFAFGGVNSCLLFAHVDTLP